LIKTSGEYVGGLGTNQEVEALQQEITQLRQENLDLQQSLLNLQTPQ
jgi:cell division protein FtsL